MSDLALFDDQERLETFPPLGRLMRMGLPQELNVSNHKRLVEAIDQEDGSKSLAYLEHVHGEHCAMLALLSEWAYQYPASLVTIAPDVLIDDVNSRFFESYAEELEALKKNDHAVLAVETLLEHFQPDRITADAADKYRKDIGDGLPNPFSAATDNDFRSLKRFIEIANWREARASLDAYWTLCLTFHDGLVQFTSTYPTHIYLTLGQEITEELVNHSFSNCSFFEGLWGLVGSLEPDQLAAFLAEHLRFHFSGSERGGACEVIEESDRYRLVFAPCGSGGALRRRTPNITKLETASPSTWNRSGEVPAYCSHCAHNEITSIKKFGYPIMVTEFDPDPNKPCGWTVYKSPELIPKELYERVGMTKGT